MKKFINGIIIEIPDKQEEKKREIPPFVQRYIKKEMRNEVNKN